MDKRWKCGLALYGSQHGDWHMQISEVKLVEVAPSLKDLPWLLRVGISLSKISPWMGHLWLTLLMKQRYVWKMNSCGVSSTFLTRIFWQVKAGGSVQNKGWLMEKVDYKDTSVPEAIRIRGFRFKKIEQLEKQFSEPGKFELKAWRRRTWYRRTNHSFLSSYFSGTKKPSLTPWISLGRK